MMQAHAASNSGQVAQEQPAIDIEVPERPSLAPNVRPVGEMPDTGFKNKQWLVLRDTQFLQVAELIYRVVENINGERTLDEIAERVTDATEWQVTGEHIRLIIQTKLMPLGLVLVPESSTSQAVLMPARGRDPSATAIQMRMKVIGPGIINPIAQALMWLYAPVVLVPMLVLIAITHAWAYIEQSTALAEGTLSVLYNPSLLLVVLGLMLLAGVFHEFGHASALTYGGGQVRGMGVGLYILFPLFYTDVTDSYRLGRWARVRTDLGGFYFYLIFSLGCIGAYQVTGQKFLLFVSLLIIIDIVRQLFIPFLKFDGYWALADLTGIPDFFSMMVPFVRSLFPGKKLKGDKLPPLKPWVKAVFIGYIVLAVPILLFLLFLTVRNLPSFVKASWDGLSLQAEQLVLAANHGNYPVVLLLVLQIALLALPVVGIVYMLYAAFRPLAQNLWRWSFGRPGLKRRVAGVLVATSTVALVAWLWAPQLSAMAQVGPPGTQTFEVTGRAHVETKVTYPQNPPVGGDHAPVWQNCGFYDTKIAPENAVHSMEHGAVWLTYKPNLPKEDIDKLRALAGSRTHVLVSPYEGLSSPVVASAWGHQLKLTSAEDPRLDRFLKVFRLGPDAPERGGPCSDGKGTP